MASLWSKPFFSHPGHLLKDHLRDVGEASAYYIKAARVNNEALVRVAGIVGKTHDFAKYSTYFQRNLQGEKIEKKLSSHAPLSAIFTAWNTSRELKDPFLTTAAYLCVLKHHGNLINFPETLNQFEFTPFLRSQLESIEKNLPKISTELSEVGVQGVDEFVINIDAIKKDIEKEIFHATRITKSSWDEYFKTLLLFSSLIDADKKDAAKISISQRRILSPNLVDEYKKMVFGKQSIMDELRNDLYESVMRSLEKLGIPPRRIMTITAPTGSGKTLLSLSVALKLRKQLTGQGAPPRIIYCLPFINIIEQTNKVFYDVLEKGGCSINPEVLLKHHHLFIPVSKDEVSLHKALELQESWDSEIVVTTFIQLMHTLVGHRNSFLKKFHNMANAIIILDEVQTIPIEYWRLAKELFKNFAEKTSSHVILMTATQPLIFGEDEAIELVPDSQKYFEKLDRTRLHYNPEKMKIKDAAKLAQEIWKRCQSLLIVVNTIKSSIDLYEELRIMMEKIVRIAFDEKELDDANIPVIAYLSTNIIPKERTRRVELIKKHLGKRKVLVVSTQVVEAGVDLDFDAVIRDIAPTDSINQVAGRCNRSGRPEKGEVHIINLSDKNGNLYANRVYSKEHVRISSALLEEKREASEKDFLKKVGEYFQNIAHYEGFYNSDKSLKNIQNVKELNFDNLSKFSLIEDEPTEAVFVEYDHEATEALTEFTKRLEEFREAERGDEAFNKRAILRAARVKLEEYMINIRKQDCHQKETIQNTTIRYLRKDDVEKNYDRETGYKRSTVSPAIW